MRLLLDTNALIFLLRGDDRLGQVAREAIGNSDNTVFVSAVSLFEMAVKIRIGKLGLNLPAAFALIDGSAVQRLEIEDSHLEAMAQMVSVGGHRDPYDLMLIAQAMVENLVVVTSDRHFQSYPITVMTCEQPVSSSALPASA